jgi:hypothetical protein
MEKTTEEYQRSEQGGREPTKMAMKKQTKLPKKI